MTDAERENDALIKLLSLRLKVLPIGYLGAPALSLEH